MNPEMIGGIIRAFLGAVGGYLATKGYGDEQTWQMVAGAVVTLATVAWSMISKAKAPVVAAPTVVVQPVPVPVAAPPAPPAPPPAPPAV
jgi:hypothetical protein